MTGIPAALQPNGALVARASIEFARTADGWDLALHHYPGVRNDLPPAILVSGYACNRYFVDFNDRYSLARFLARRGVDAWVLELRGHGHSELAIGRRRGWTFDDLVRLDVPAAITHVRAQTTGQRLVWIGHSMGGMIAYAALGLNPAVHEALAGLVTIASPMGFPAVTSPTLRTLGEAFLALPLPQRLPQRGVLVALWSVLRWSPGAAQAGMNAANTDLHAFGRALRLFMCSVPRSKLRQLAQWSLTGEFRSCDGTVDYRANLPRIRTAALIIAGATDHLASPQMVRFAYDRISSTEKRYREFGLRSGDSADYGHVDLIFGRRAPEEVFPVIGDWIEHELTKG